MCDTESFEGHALPRVGFKGIQNIKKKLMSTDMPAFPKTVLSTLE